MSLTLTDTLVLNEKVLVFSLRSELFSGLRQKFHWVSSSYIYFAGFTTAEHILDAQRIGRHASRKQGKREGKGQRREEREKREKRKVPKTPLKSPDKREEDMERF